ncbi:NAD(P)/FAD-dependent oxidoreductase [Trinickia fusca]|uniref:NAD(P)/FAD-dependent oxidoreductase n=1 Tax=Trinickia fusca TaxID=2419777 RepID=A0A494X5M4_9BURK|nr:NAD(P)/FAD-dependent oxidoreductase [Trinickia fusca]RKP45987.1 NAD(P)/FAD-dependent oxidoreductase [Trinickia fusca]
MSLPRYTKVLVIGGGPAGATTAGFLAREGVEVTVLDREVFPRYHIGESLLPSCLEIVGLMGARKLFDSYGFQRKPGAYFNWKGETWTLDFGELGGSYRYSYQVRREDFDYLLLSHARTMGAKVHEGVTVRELQFEDGRPRRAVCSVKGSESLQTIEFDYLVDASGRNGVMATGYLENRKFHDIFRNIAAWGYWKNANWPKDCAEGAILVASVPDGWWWGIPLSDGTVSVGLVQHRDAFTQARRNNSLEQLYENALAMSPLMTDLVKGAELVSPIKTEQDYSYASEAFQGKGFFLAGDSACFLDPLLSTGVHLAMYSGMLSAASIASILRGEVTEEEACAYYESSYRQAYVRFVIFVQTFYEAHGKLGYWSKADELSHYTLKAGDLHRAFLNLVSGLEDIADVEQVTSHLMGEMARRVDENLSMRKDKSQLGDKIGSKEAEDNARFFDAIEGLPCLSEDMALEGLYVSTKPRLGLRRVAVTV